MPKSCISLWMLFCILFSFLPIQDPISSHSSEPWLNAFLRFYLRMNCHSLVHLCHIKKPTPLVVCWSWLLLAFKNNLLHFQELREVVGKQSHS